MKKLDPKIFPPVYCIAHTQVWEDIAHAPCSYSIPFTCIDSQSKIVAHSPITVCGFGHTYFKLLLTFWSSHNFWFSIGLSHVYVVRLICMCVFTSIDVVACWLDTQATQHIYVSELYYYYRVSHD